MEEMTIKEHLRAVKQMCDNEYCSNCDAVDWCVTNKNNYTSPCHWTGLDEVEE